MPVADPPGAVRREVGVHAGTAVLDGTLVVPPAAAGLVVFAHGTGSSRHSPRGARIAGGLQHAGFATLVLDLLTGSEEGLRPACFDVGLLARRLELATAWAGADPLLGRLPVGYCGTGTGAAAALLSAAALADRVRAVVCRGGRPELVGSRLLDVTAPTLFVVGEHDDELLLTNRTAADRMRCPARVAVVPGAGHLFEEPGALDVVASLATGWFGTHLRRAACGLDARGLGAFGGDRR